MDYNELVQKRQDGFIDDLEFLLSQEELAEIYLKEMSEKGEPPSCENAMKWLLEYENKHLYEDL